MQKPNGQPFVLTMFRHFALFVWLNPLIVEDKPVIHFADALHAIMSKSNSYPTIGSGFEGLGLDALADIRNQLKLLGRLRRRKGENPEKSSLKGYNCLSESKAARNHVFDISKCKCYVIIGRRTGLKSLAVSPHCAERAVAEEVVLTRLIEIAESLMAVNRKQQVLEESIDNMGTQIGEMKAILKIVSDHLANNPQSIAAALDSLLDKMKLILLELSKQLSKRHPKKARKAKSLYDCLWHGVAKTADLLEVFGFITGITTAQVLLSNNLVQQIIDFLKDVMCAVG